MSGRSPEEIRACADAILDRVVHSSHKIELKGKSLRDHEQDK